MEQIVIRKAVINDLDILLRFEQDLIEAERPFDSTIKREHIHYYDLKKMLEAPNIEIVVAQINNKIIGSGYARIENSKPFLKHATHAYLGFMFVEPTHRGKGVNKKIITVLKEWAYSQNVHELRLDVYTDNISAIKAYEKLGFNKISVEMRLNLRKDPLLHY